MRWLLKDTAAVGAAIWSRRLVRTCVSKSLMSEDVCYGRSVAVKDRNEGVPPAPLGAANTRLAD